MIRLLIIPAVAWPGVTVMHEIMHEIILATIVLKSQGFKRSCISAL